MFSGSLIAQSVEEYPQETDYQMQHWTTANGLPANFIGDLIFDENETLWMTTFGGLVNMSGDELKVFTKFNNSEVKHDVFRQFQVDENGKILAVGNQSVKIINGELESIDRLDEDQILGIYSVLLDAGKIWFSGEDGVCILEQLELKSCSKTDAMIVNGIATIEGQYLFGSIGGGIKKFDIESNSYDRISIKNAPDDTLSVYKTSWNQVLLSSLNTVYTFDPELSQAEVLLESSSLGEVNSVDSEEGQALLATSSGLYLYSRKEGLSKVFDGKDFYKVRRDFYGRYWIISETGIHVLDQDFKEIDFPKSMIPGGEISDLEIDSRGGVWLSSQTGLYRYLRKPILALTPDNGLLKGMPWSIFPDNLGGLLIGVYSGGISYLSETGIEEIPLSDGAMDISLDLKPVIRDSKNQIWFASHRNGGLYRRNVSGELRNFEQLLDADSKYNILYELAADRILVGVLGRGLFVIENEEKIIEILDPLGESISTAWTLYLDRKGRLLIGGPHGIFEIDPSDLTTRKIEILGIPEGFLVSSILEDREGVLWLGSGGQGLARSKGESFSVATSADGLVDNKIWQIFESKSGYLWFSTDRGIGSFHKNEFERAIVQEEGLFKSYHFNEVDGMPIAEGTGGSYPLGYEDKSGRFWFTGIEGISIVDPIVAEKSLEDFRFRIASINSQKINNDEFLELESDVDHISIEIASNEFGEAGSKYYRYRLRGYQETWQETNSNPSPLNYYHLSPGDYTFELEVLNRSVVSSSSVESIDIKLADVWINSPWLRLLALFLVLALLFGLYWWDRGRRDRSQLVKLVDERTKELEEKNSVVSNQRNELEELHQMRLAFFENFTHEFRRSLSLILGPLVELGQEEDMSPEWRSQIGNAALHANYLSEVVRKLVDSFTIESEAIKLNLTNSDISKTLDTTVRLFEPLAIAKGIELISEDFREDKFVHDPNFVRMVVNNLLSNAVKFTPEKGFVEIRTSRDYANRKFNVVVSDTGPGIPDSHKDKIFERFVSINPSNPDDSSGMGLGLHLSKAIAKIHQGDISIYDRDGGGSVFVLTIPLNLSLDPEGNRQGNFGEFEPIIGMRNIGGVAPSVSENRSGLLTTEADAIRVLLIEDDLEFLTYLKNSLTKIGFEILAAQNAEDAILILEKQSVDLVTTDILLPGMTGIEFIQAAQKKRLLDGIPVFVLSGKSDLDTRIAALDLGALEYVVKPIVAAELGARIRSLVSLRKQLSEKSAQATPILIEGLLESEDIKFYNSLVEAINNNLSNSEYNVSWMADDLAKGVRNLQRRTKFVTGQSPVEFLKTMRIDAAKVIMDSGRKIAIAEIALKVGYSDRKRFSKHFRELTGMPPSKYIKSLKTDSAEAFD